MTLSNFYELNIVRIVINIISLTECQSFGIRIGDKSILSAITLVGAKSENARSGYIETIASTLSSL